MTKQVVIGIAVVVTLALGVAVYAVSRPHPVAMTHEGTAAEEAMHTDKTPVPRKDSRVPINYRAQL